MRRCIHVILQAEFSTSFEQPRVSHHLQIMEDTGQSPRSHGQPFQQLRSHWQAPRQGWQSQDGGGGSPSRREEAGAVAGGGKRTARGLRGRGGPAAAGQEGDRHPDRWRRQRSSMGSPPRHGQDQNPPAQSGGCSWMLSGRLAHGDILISPSTLPHSELGSPGH
ncbi:uncharacterized protein LOC124905441 isoform X3 [Homo sapiens]|uniref:uncharacterized protein LOC124905441 isoform X3 n=1 Tax=Homo sapiens TaxID=9606 RepID=UPI001FB14BEC|nr:uncharacterized protein LOC124905441 isoform X3 [Homo sapiens]